MLEITDPGGQERVMLPVSQTQATSGLPELHWRSVYERPGGQVGTPTVHEAEACEGGTMTGGDVWEMEGIRGWGHG